MKHHVYSEAERCRLCSSSTLVPVISLGNQALTGVFPKSKSEIVPEGPLDLVACGDCALLQLRHNYPASLLYGSNYGYRSGLNKMMVEHLHSKARALETSARLQPGELVLDIGSNDGTLLKAYATPSLKRVGMDPTASKFLEFYPSTIKVLPQFFSATEFLHATGGVKARIITSIAMFYDLPDPLAFVRAITDCLHDEGVWHFEQSYMPSMLAATAYDTICHEHVEYYGLRQIKWLLDHCDMKIVGLELNDVNGGSFAVTAAKTQSHYRQEIKTVAAIVEKEEDSRYECLGGYSDFVSRVCRHRRELVALVRELKARGKRVCGYGASTKGNVLLQYCGFGPDDIAYIAEVNPDKFGAITPGTHIPIVSESDVRTMNPDYLLVLPWHFRKAIVEREHEYLNSGGKLIFPLPNVEIVGECSSGGLASTQSA
jgi:hypothetical protein